MFRTTSYRPTRVNSAPDALWSLNSPVELSWVELSGECDHGFTDVLTFNTATVNWTLLCNHFSDHRCDSFNAAIYNHRRHERSPSSCMIQFAVSIGRRCKWSSQQLQRSSPRSVAATVACTVGLYSPCSSSCGRDDKAMLWKFFITRWPRWVNDDDDDDDDSRIVSYAVVTREITLFWNNFEIISLFYFTSNHWR